MTLSRTARALVDVDSGMSIAASAKKHGITRQSIYRLITYRAGRKRCPVCGSLVSEQRQRHG